MRIWYISEAKNHLSPLLEQARKEPQIISKRGVPGFVVLSLDKYNELINSEGNILDFFQNSPLFGIDNDELFNRDQSYIRHIDI